MIRGKTTLIAHIGYPTETFKAPMIYNPYFDSRHRRGRRADGLPSAEDYPGFLRAVFTLTNIRGALITMPHKVTTWRLLDEVIAHGEDRRRVQRRAARAGRPPGGRHVRRRRLRARRAAQGLRAARRARAGGGLRRRGLGDRGVAGRGRRRRDRPVRRNAPSAEALGGRLQRALPGARRCDRLATTRPVTTSSSTPRRWA